MAEQPKCQPSKNKHIASVFFFLLACGCLFCLELLEYECLSLGYRSLRILKDGEVLQITDEARKIEAFRKNQRKNLLV